MTRGDAIVARARAGAHMVECRERYDRLRTMARPGSKVAVALCHAEIDYAIARGTEAYIARRIMFRDAARRFIEDNAELLRRLAAWD